MSATELTEQDLEGGIKGYNEQPASELKAGAPALTPAARESLELNRDRLVKKLEELRAKKKQS